MRFCRSRWSDYIRADLPCHVLQGSELLLIDQIELGDEVVEVFVAGVDVGLGADAHDPVEVMNVDVNKDSVEPGQNLLALWLEGLREWNVRGDRKQLGDSRELIIEEESCARPTDSSLIWDSTQSMRREMY